MDKQYKVVFRFYKNGNYNNECNDDFISRFEAFFKSMVAPGFVKIRNEIVDVTNDLLEGWNTEFDKMHPDRNGWTIDYENFIIEKFKPFVDAANKKYGLTKDRWWLDYEVVFECEDMQHSDFVFKMKHFNDIYSTVITLKEM